MTDAEIWNQVVSLIREVFDDDALEVTRATTASDVAAWDSLSNIELLVALQSAFAVRFRTGEIAGLKNVGELVDTVTTRVRQANG